VSESSDNVVKYYGTRSLTATFGEGYSDLLEDSDTGPLTARFGDSAGDVADIFSAPLVTIVIQGVSNGASWSAIPHQ
jgi:hypothetical protein